MKQDNLETVVEAFTEKTSILDRNASFDYCFNYFKTTENITKDIEKSCLTLGFYLASWGMYRGSSFMLQKSVKQLEKTVRYIAELDASFWNIDVDTYKEGKNIDNIIEVYEGIKKNLMPKDKDRAHLTLITKIMLGVFGCVPAYDTYFTKTFKSLSNNECGFSSFDKKSLEYIYEFYIQNQEDIDKLSKKIKTLDFVEEKKTDIMYPKAKIIDMYGFNSSFK
jgi:hypothetical protein